MARGVVTFVVLASMLVVLGVACGSPPTASGGSDSPNAQATSVRRTAEAAVQRIIANNSTATPLPDATATRTPTCPGAIWWSEAHAHLGETRSVQGTVVGSRPAAAGSSLVEIGQAYPDPTGFVVLLPGPPPTTLNGKSVCVAGRITTAEGRPAVQLRDPAGIITSN